MKALVILTIIFSSMGEVDVQQLINDPCFLMEESKGPCLYDIDGRDYLIHTNGKISLIDTDITVNITLPEYFQIEGVKHETYEGDILFNFSIRNCDSASTMIVRLASDNLKIKWQTEFIAFNSSQMLIDEGAVYVAGIGTIAKIDINSGSIVWEHDGLYERDSQAFNSFIKPRRDGDLIIFEENKVATAKYFGIRKIIVNRVSGEILSK